MKHEFKHNFLKRVPISKRFFLLTLVVSILPILIIGLFCYTTTKHSISRLSSAYNERILHALQSNIRLNFQNYIQVADEIMLSSSVRNALPVYDSLEPDEKYDVVMDILSEIRSKFSRIADIYNVQIVTTENIPIYNTGFLFLESESWNEQFEKIKNCPDNTLWSIFPHKNDTFFVLSRKITDYSGNIIGYIIIHIRPNTLSELFSAFENTTSVTMADSFGEVFSASYDGVLPESLDQAVDYVRSQPKNGRILSYTGNRDYYVHYTYFDYAGWYLITTIPSSVLNAPIRGIQLSIFIMITLCIVICSFVSQYISRSITVPLTKMVENIQHISNAYLKEHPNVPENELEFLSGAYQQILGKISDLTLQVQEEQEEKRIAEIKMLQAQINPHFLFNTLDSLKFAALMSNAPTVSEGLSSLSHILRNSIIDGKSDIPIKEEVQNISDYLTIQKIRSGESIDFTAQIEPEAQSCCIMKFLLQPLVENSVIHGMQNNFSLRIYLHVRKENEKIIIELKDNGKGFDVEEQYDSEHDRFKSSKMSGIGLENVRQRLYLKYKKEQTFFIKSTPGQGTDIYISYPADKEEL